MYRCLRVSPLQFAFVYVFNLIVGVGALAFPKVFSNAGYILVTILLIILAGMRYESCVYLIKEIEGKTNVQASTA